MEINKYTKVSLFLIALVAVQFISDKTFSPKKREQQKREQQKREQQKREQREVSSESKNSTYQKLCSLPPQFIVPEVYKTFCSPQQTSCLRVGMKCSFSLSCCSGQCGNGTCTPTSLNPALPGDRCENNSDCLSQDCRLHPQRPYRICYGSRDQLCSQVGDLCAENTNCCSGYCLNNKCLGSQTDPARAGSYCFADNSECQSYYCNQAMHRCE